MEKDFSTIENMLKRRKVLAGIAGTTVGTGIGVSASLSRLADESNYQGIPKSYIKTPNSTRFEDFVEQSYEIDDFDVGAYDALVDARYVEGEKFTSEHVLAVEQFFENIGIDLKFLERKDEISLDLFESEYGASTSEILGYNGSLYSDAVEDVMKDTAIQLFFTPGIETGFGERIENGKGIDYERLKEMNAEDLEEGMKLGPDGVALYDRAVVVADEYDNIDFSERDKHADTKLYKTIHELAHTMGLGHVDNPDNLMHEENLRPAKSPGLNDKQINKIEKQLGL